MKARIGYARMLCPDGEPELSEIDESIGQQEE
jgi:hypothetical protein